MDDTLQGLIVTIFPAVKCDIFRIYFRNISDLEKEIYAVLRTIWFTLQDGNDFILKCWSSRSNKEFVECFDKNNLENIAKRLLDYFERFIILSIEKPDSYNPLVSYDMDNIRAEK